MDKKHMRLHTALGAILMPVFYCEVEFLASFGYETEPLKCGGFGAFERMVGASYADFGSKSEPCGYKRER